MRYEANIPALRAEGIMSDPRSALSPAEIKRLVLDMTDDPAAADKAWAKAESERLRRGVPEESW